MQIEGIPTTICLQDGKTLRNLKPKGTEKPIYKNLYLLTKQEAEQLFLTSVAHTDVLPKVSHSKVKEAGPLRTIKKGKAKVAEAPAEADWEQAAVYQIKLEPAPKPGLLSITYQGDCARLYCNGKLIADNFQYGRPFLYGLWRLPEGVTELELRILPLQPDAPIYLPREADHIQGETVKSITITASR